jgi:hypothetical protein
MPVLEYSIGVYRTSSYVFSMSLYVFLSEKAAEYGDDPFTEDVNGCGPSKDLEQWLCQ